MGESDTLPWAYWVAVVTLLGMLILIVAEHAGMGD
jgi:hypothetical protein